MKKMLILGLLSLFLVVPTYAHNRYKDCYYGYSKGCHNCYRPILPRHNMRPMPLRMNHGGFFYDSYNGGFWNRMGNRIGFYFSF